MCLYLTHAVLTLSCHVSVVHGNIFTLVRHDLELSTKSEFIERLQNRARVIGLIVINIIDVK
jgi:hypothetical protein